MAQPQTVNLTIKNANTRFADFQIEIPLKDTIATLKQRLSEQYPENPPPSAQKLIFSGRLLQDQSTLEEILNQHDTSFPQTFHIVINRLQMQQQQQQQQQEQRPPVFQPMNPPQGMAGNPNTQTRAFFAQMRVGGNLPPIQPFNQFGPGVPPFVPNAFVPPHQQQEFRQFQQQQYQQQFQAQVPRPQEEFNQPPRDDNMVPREDRNQLHLLFKLALLVYIFGQGGTTTRWIVLSIGAFLIYLYQTGRLRITYQFQHNVHRMPPAQPQPAQAQPQPAQAQAQAQAQAEAEPPAENLDQPMDAQANPQAPNNENNTVQPPAPRPGILTEFVLPFFYSLFPTYQPQQVAQ